MLICAAMNAAALFAWWGLFTWVPRFLSMPVEEGGRGLSIAQTSEWTIVMEAGTFLGIGLANAVMMLNPDAVILLGGVARAGALILDPVRRVFDAQPFREPFSALELSLPEEREWGCIGAALLARERR